MEKINREYLLKIQRYCDSRAYKKEYGYNEKESIWEETTEGKIGNQLACISAAIEEILELNKH